MSSSTPKPEKNTNAEAPAPEKNGKSAPPRTIPLSKLGKRKTGTITHISANLRNCKKFSDVGFVKGTEVKLEQKAPFGGLIRVSVMDTSISLHSEDADNIMVQVNPDK